MIIITTKDALEYEAKLNTYLGQKNNIVCWVPGENSQWIGRILSGFSKGEFIILNDIAQFESAPKIMIKNEDYDAWMSEPLIPKIMAGISNICLFPFRAIRDVAIGIWDWGGWVLVFLSVLAAIAHPAYIKVRNFVNSLPDELNTIEITAPRIVSINPLQGGYTIAFDNGISYLCGDIQESVCKFTQQNKLFALYTYMSDGSCKILLKNDEHGAVFYENPALSSDNPDKCKAILAKYPPIQH